MVIGSRADSEEGPSYPFVWNPSTETFVDLSTLGGSASTDGHAYAINDLGQIVGYEQRGGVIQAMLWQLPGTSLPLGPLPGDTHSRANGINDAGQVVGISTSETQDIWHGFIWEEGVIQNVGDLGVGDVSQPSTITSSGLVGGFQGSNFDLEGLWRAYVVSEADGIVDAGSLPGDESAAIIGSGGTGLFVGVSGDPRGLVGIPGAFSNATLFEVELTTGGGDATVDEILDELVEAGTIEPGQHNALVAKLRAAENQLSRGNCTAAANQIRAFVSQVEALVAAGTLSADEGAALVTAAEALLAEAGC
jgi:probable HAF family extracellular repeat protein